MPKSKSHGGDDYVFCAEAIVALLTSQPPDEILARHAERGQVPAPAYFEACLQLADAIGSLEEAILLIDMTEIEVVPIDRDLTVRCLRLEYAGKLTLGGRACVALGDARGLRLIAPESWRMVVAPDRCHFFAAHQLSADQR